MLLCKCKCKRSVELPRFCRPKLAGASDDSTREMNVNFSSTVIRLFPIVALNEFFYGVMAGISKNNSIIRCGWHF